MTGAEVGAAEQASDRDVAMATCFAVHYSRLVRIALLLVDDRETAEDVVMDAFVGLRLRWRFLDDPSDSFRYLRSSVLNGARSKLRRRRVARLFDRRRLVEAMDTVDSAEATVLTHDRDSALGRAVRDLPRRQKEVVVLRYYLDMSEAEIAQALGISQGAVKSHASRALRALAHTTGGSS